MQFIELLASVVFIILGEKPSVTVLQTLFYAVLLFLQERQFHPRQDDDLVFFWGFFFFLFHFEQFLLLRLQVH